MKFDEVSVFPPGTWVRWIQVSGEVATGIVLGVVPNLNTHRFGFLWALTGSGDVKIPVNLIFRMRSMLPPSEEHENR